MTSFPARLFTPDSPTGEAAELTFLGDDIEARTADKTQHVALKDLRVRTTGVDLSGIEFAWNMPNGAHAIHITDAEALRSLHAHPQISALPQMTSLRMKQRRSDVTRHVGWTVVGLIVALPVLLLLAFVWQADNLAMAVANRIPIEQEVQLGDQSFEQLRTTLKLQDSGPAYEAVHALGTRLTQDSRYRYRFHVAESKDINAFALPGGIIVVYTGLIQATQRPEELAGVLAHEVQHVERRHSLQGMIKDMGLRGMWLLVTGDISSAWGQAAIQLASLKFSRDAETEADQHGFDILVANHIDPSGMADFFAVLAKKNADIPEFLSTHPLSAQREEHLRERQQTLQGQHFEPLHFGAWPP